jgi:acyl carrier protein
MAIGSQDPALKAEIKRIIVAASERELPPSSIGDDDTLIGADSMLGFDSLDALQIAVAIGKRFNVRIRDSKHARIVMRSVNTLADFIQPT